MVGGMCGQHAWQGGMRGRGHSWQGVCMEGGGRGMHAMHAPPSRYYKIR